MHDLKVAIRSLRAAPVVAVAAILSLALGIGANTAIFSLVDSVMFRALNVHAPERLAWFVVPGRGVPAKTRFAIFEEIRARGQLFDGVLATSSSRLTLTAGGESQAIDGLFTSGSFFDVLGVHAFVGRTFTAADDGSEAPGAIAPVAVISHGFWQRQFGGARDIVGRTVTLDTVPVTIVGVTPRLFFGPEVGRTFDVAVPLGVERAMHGAESWANRASLLGPLSVMVRLKPGRTIEAGTAAIRNVQPQIRAATLPPADVPAQYLGQFLSDPLTLEPAASVASPVQRRFTPSLMTLMAVVALVLLIACANLANLQLARATARTRELAVRRALGASPWQLARQLLTESTLVGGLGAALGIVFARWSTGALVRAVSTVANPVVLDLSVDVRVLLFTIAVTALTIVLFGVAPAFRASSVSATAAIRSDRSAAAGGVRVGVTQVLIVAQVALALVLVTGAGLFARTFASLAERPLGFDADPVLVVAINAQRAAATPAQRVPLYARIREAVRRLPGVADAAVSARAPIVSGPMLALPIEGVSGGPPVTPLNRISFVNLTSDGWFRTLGTRLVAGRDFSGSDSRQSAPVALVNQAFARAYVDAANPIGRRVAVNVPRPGPPAEFEIVGVVSDTVYRFAAQPGRAGDLPADGAARRHGVARIREPDRQVERAAAGVAGRGRRSRDSRRQPAAVGHGGDDARADRRGARAGTRARGSVRRVRRAGAAPCVGGALRHHGIRGRAPASRDGHPHGARRDAGRSGAERARARVRAHRRRRGRRRRRERMGVAVHRVALVQVCSRAIRRRSRPPRSCSRPSRSAPRGCRRGVHRASIRRRCSEKCERAVRRAMSSDYNDRFRLRAPSSVVEHVTFNHGVPGSIPGGPTSFELVDLPNLAVRYEFRLGRGGVARSLRL